MSDSNMSWPELMKWLIDDQLRSINSNIGVIMGKLDDAKAALEANDAKITEIAGDLAEVKTKAETAETQNAELLMRIQELQSQQDNNPLIDDILAKAQIQSTTLSELAAIIPEPGVDAPTEPTENV